MLAGPLPCVEVADEGLGVRPCRASPTEEAQEGVSVMRAQSLSFGDASNGPVNILTAVLFAAEDERAARAASANEHFGSLNDS